MINSTGSEVEYRSLIEALSSHFLVGREETQERESLTAVSVEIRK
jgi:hypothetical protein